jgi:hypothetical protein
MATAWTEVMPAAMEQGQLQAHDHHAEVTAPLLLRQREYGYGVA